MYGYSTSQKARKSEKRPVCLVCTHRLVRAATKQTKATHSTSTANQIDINTNLDTHCKQTWTAITTTTDKILTKSDDKYTRESTPKHHLGADDKIMRIIKRRGNSPVTSELVERRIKLTKHGHMRYSWQKRFERESLLPRRAAMPTETRSKELTGNYEEKNHDETRSRYSIDGFIITRRTSYNTRTGNQTREQEYRDGPIEEIAVYYIRKSASQRTEQHATDIGRKMCAQ